MIVTGRRHRYQLDEELRDDPSKRGEFQDNWQNDEGIAAQDGRATDDNGRVKA